MKLFIALFAAAVLGLGGVIYMHESGRSSSAAASGSGAKVATISNGETVDLDAHVRGSAWTVVEFTADW